MRLPSCLVVFSVVVVPAIAQCTLSLAPTGPTCGVEGPVLAAVAWDPDGPGPRPEWLAVGGEFTAAGAVLANRVAALDPATGAFVALGGGCNGSVRALAVLPNGFLVAGGNFTAAGGVAANRIAVFDGASWWPLGSGSTNRPVSALAVAANGDLIAAGAFPAMGGVVVNGVARWDGTTWSDLGGGLPGYSLFAATVMPNGDVIVGGLGPSSGAPCLARWDGSAWSTFGVLTLGAYFGSVSSLAAAANGDLLVAGAFTAIDGVAANGVARWNGSSFAALGNGTSGITGSPGINSLCLAANGDVVVGGRFALGGGAIGDRVARWSGSAWSALGAPMLGTTNLWPAPNYILTPEVLAVAPFANGTLVAAGRFAVAGAAAAQNVAQWNGSAWSALTTGDGIDGVEHVVELPGGDVVAVGNFLAAGGVLTNGVARWNGSIWSRLGSSGMNPGGVGFASVRLPNGDLVVGGSFTAIGGVAAPRVARWNGSQWAPVGALPVQSADVVRALAVAPDGTLYAGGSLHTSTGFACLATWNGIAWSAVPGSQYGEVFSLAFLPDGRLAVGGQWLTPSDHALVLWDGVTWTPYGAPWDTGTVNALAVLPNGDLVDGGIDGNTGRVRRWVGGVATVLGAFNGLVEDLHVLPNGELLVGGWFGYGNPGGALAGLARWNGSSWSPVAGGIGGSLRRAGAFAASASGAVWVGGSFGSAGTAAAGGLARLASSCPATVQVQGAGCDGDTVTSTLPWLGSTWRAEGGGLPSAALVGSVYGFAPTALPLVSVFATALPGCTLHVQPDHVELVLGSNGTASVQFVLPTTPTLVGIGFRHQMVSMALDATLAVSASDALALTVGSF